MNPLAVIIAYEVVKNHGATVKTKKAAGISAKAAARVVEAEMKIEEHEAAAIEAYDSLCTRIYGIASFFKGPFSDVYKPFEQSDGSLLEDMFGQDFLKELMYIKKVDDKIQLSQLPAHKKQTGAPAVIYFLLFNRGRMAEANRKMDSAKTQREVSYLLEAHGNSICTLYDLQRENYLRAYQVLGALNVALIMSTQQARKGLETIRWLLDEEGHIPKGMSSNDLKLYLPKETMADIGICLNIAKTIYAILEEPMFNEEAELTEKAKKVLAEGDEALKRIKSIKRK